MTIKRFVMYSGITLLMALVLAPIAAPFEETLTVIVCVTVATAVGWLLGRIQSIDES